MISAEKRIIGYLGTINPYLLVNEDGSTSVLDSPATEIEMKLDVAKRHGLKYDQVGLTPDPGHQTNLIAYRKDHSK